MVSGAGDATDLLQLLTSVLPQYLELLRSHQNRPAKCLTIMWALGQAGFADLTEGLKGKCCWGHEPRVPGVALALSRVVVG